VVWIYQGVAGHAILQAHGAYKKEDAPGYHAGKTVRAGAAQMSNSKTFYTDHWREIEDERIARYEQMFVWRDQQRILLEGADMKPGQRVLDVGCGPGFFALGLADIVGPEGQVDGVDINARFVADATRRADRRNVRFHHLTDHRLPFADATFDRVILKNVLEYVPDLAATLSEVFRVMRPGGRAHVIDSDWGFLLVEPWGKERTEAFFDAAAPAFNERYIGRKAAGALRGAGFASAGVKIHAFADQAGNGLGVLTNMVGYIRTFDTMPAEVAEGMLEEARAAVPEGRFLFCLPQFLVTAERI